MATQEERRSATRRRIIDAARSCFVETGWEATTLGDIQAAAGVSRGALYHHFDAKHEIAEAVFAEVSQDAITRAATDVDDDAAPFDALRDSCLRWLEIVAEPTVATLMFDVGPSALGWTRCRELEEEHSLRLMTRAVRRAADAGDIRTDAPEVLAKLLNAVLAEAALALVDPRSRHEPAAVRSTTAAVLESLRV